MTRSGDGEVRTVASRPPRLRTTSDATTLREAVPGGDPQPADPQPADRARSQSWRSGVTDAALTEVLLCAEQGQLDRDFAEYLLNLAFYPVGTIVELADGRVGIVVANHPNRLDPRAPGRPVIAVLTAADGVLLPHAEHLDLAGAAQGGIVRGLPADQARELLGSRYPDLVC